MLTYSTSRIGVMKHLQLLCPATLGLRYASAALLDAGETTVALARRQLIPGHAR